MFVTWLPAHPDEGSMSMQRYWFSLDAAARSRSKELTVRCPLGSPVFPAKRRSRTRRALSRHIYYPLLVRARVRSGVVHVLDHSSAHLIPLLPAGCRVVATVHDLNPLRDSSDLSPAQAARFRRIVGHLRKADRLIAVSQFTADDVHRFLGVPADRIRVIPNGVDPVRRSPPSERTTPVDSALGERDSCLRVLAVGSTQRRKNLELLPPIFEAMSGLGASPTLVRVGEKLPHDLRRKLVRVLGESRLVELGTISAEELQRVYQRVDVLVFPSTLEGFGLPLLEAMAAGCPVVSSDAASLPEVGGDAALYFDPSDSDQAAQQILRVHTDSHLRNTMIALGRQRSEMYSWDRHLEGVLGVYREVWEAGGPERRPNPA
jgi:glycosyltransferase involved in cell wall biosynthesis